MADAEVKTISQKPSLLGVSPEVRIHIYSFLLKSQGAIDTVLVRKNSRIIMREGRLAKKQNEEKYRQTLANIRVQLNKWDDVLNLFLVCRTIYLEATAYFYGQNTFDFFSPNQCLQWLNGLTPTTAGLPRSLSLPLTNQRDDGKGRELMESLPSLAGNVQTVSVANMADNSGVNEAGYSNVRSWPIGVQNPGYWNKWMQRWGCKDDGTAGELTPPGGPFRRIVATRAEGGVEGEQSEIDQYDRVGKDLILFNLSRLTQLRTVHLNESFGGIWDGEMARMLAKVEREHGNGKILGQLE